MNLRQEWEEQALEIGLTKEDFEHFKKADTVDFFCTTLPRRFPVAEIDDWQHPCLRQWEFVGNVLRAVQRYYDALTVYSRLYEHILAAQDNRLTTNDSRVPRIHKGQPLLWMHECFVALGFDSIAKRYLMLTLCEDAIQFEGCIDPARSGLYFRAVWRGIPEVEIRRYATRIFELYQADPKMCRYPEWILQNLGIDWMDGSPSPAESWIYIANRAYFRHLLSMLPDPRGKIWEIVCEYALSCIPGCRTQRNIRAEAGEYDVVCSISGQEMDFRAELGRYFVCECKDRRRRATFTEMAKFCRVLDATKSKFGILFSVHRITGEKPRAREAAVEQMRVYFDRGIVVVCIDIDDIKELERGENFIRMLRERFEAVRLSKFTTGRARRSLSKPISVRQTK